VLAQPDSSQKGSLFQEKIDVLIDDKISVPKKAPIYETLFSMLGRSK